MKSLQYKLDEEHNPVLEPDLLAWGVWMESADRTVMKTRYPNGALISTVFLGLDHNFFGGTPILFETMIFDFDAATDYQERCATWNEAIEMHKRAEGLLERQGQLKLPGAEDASTPKREG